MHAIVTKRCQGCPPKGQRVVFGLRYLSKPEFSLCNRHLSGWQRGAMCDSSRAQTVLPSCISTLPAPEKEVARCLTSVTPACCTRCVVRTMTAERLPQTEVRRAKPCKTLGHSSPRFPLPMELISESPQEKGRLTGPAGYLGFQIFVSRRS